MIYTIRTGNVALAAEKIPVSSRSAEMIPIDYDANVADWQWALYRDGKRMGHPRDIGLHVVTEIRKAAPADQWRKTDEPVKAVEQQATFDLEEVRSDAIHG